MIMLCRVHSTRRLQSVQSGFIFFALYTVRCTRGRAAMASQENDILSHLEDIISRKFESLERRMSENQQLSQAQLNSIQENLSRNENYTFRKKGNEEQYKINNQVLNKLRRIFARIRQVAAHRVCGSRE